MKAGRELDALVAEKIFELYSFYEGPELLYVKKKPSKDRQTHYEVPNYSTDISAAWEVVEKLNYLSFNISRENCAGVRYDANVYDDPEMEDQINITADTAPHAICLAALKAVGHE